MWVSHLGLKPSQEQGCVLVIFKWRIIHGHKWRYTSHIHALELQAVVNGLSWRLRKLSNHRKRVLHLVDSQVAASIISKGRTLLLSAQERYPETQQFVVVFRC